MSNWYVTKTPDDNLSQGDIFLDFPIIIPNVKAEFASENWIETCEVGYDLYAENIVVMTQACDLERDPTAHVLIAIMKDINDIELPKPKKENGQQISRKNYIKEIHSGRRPNLHLIGKNDEGIPINYQVVDFTTVFSVPYTYINKFAKSLEQRLRLNTPHREYLSQRFGNFYSRIGLPNDDHISENEVINALKG